MIWGRRAFFICGLALAVGCGDAGDETTSTTTRGAGGAATTSSGAGANSSTGGSATTTTGAGGGGGSMASVCPPGPFGDPLPANPEVVVVDDVYDFLEGPVWLADQGVLLFSNMVFGQSGPDGWPPATIYRLTPPSTIDVFLDTNGNGDLGVNGLGVDAAGQIIGCTHDERSISRIDPVTKARVTVAARYMGDRFNSPNDNIARRDGTIYFTDPTWQLGSRMQEIDFKGVYRISPGGDVSLVADDFGSPNGIALSPDETTLYVADDQNGHVRAFAIAPDGSTSGGSLFTDAPGADGMAVDCAGNLYVTVNAGIKVVDDGGTTLGTIDTQQKPANATFGDVDRQSLYLTARNTLYRVRLQVPGLP